MLKSPVEILLAAANLGDGTAQYQLFLSRLQAGKKEGDEDFLVEPDRALASRILELHPERNMTPQEFMAFERRREFARGNEEHIRLRERGIFNPNGVPEPEDSLAEIPSDADEEKEALEQEAAFNELDAFGTDLLPQEADPLGDLGADLGFGAGNLIL